MATLTARGHKILARVTLKRETPESNISTEEVRELALRSDGAVLSRCAVRFKPDSISPKGRWHNFGWQARGYRPSCRMGTPLPGERLGMATIMTPEVICPRCKRLAVGWPLKRADICSPKYWRNCIREPESVLTKKGIKPNESRTS